MNRKRGECIYLSTAEVTKVYTAFLFGINSTEHLVRQSEILLLSVMTMNILNILGDTLLTGR